MVVLALVAGDRLRRDGNLELRRLAKGLRAVAIVGGGQRRVDPLVSARFVYAAGMNGDVQGFRLPSAHASSARTVSMVSASFGALSSRYRRTRAKRSATPPE